MNRFALPSRRRGAAPSIALDVLTPTLRAGLRSVLAAAQVPAGGVRAIPHASVVFVEARSDEDAFARVRSASRMDAAIVVLVSNDSVPAPRGAFATLRAPLDPRAVRRLVDAARKRAVDTNVMIGPFMASLSRISAGLHHELAGPLTVAQLNASLIERECKRIAGADPATCEILLSALADTTAELAAARETLALLRDLAQQERPSVGAVDLSDAARSAALSRSNSARSDLAIEVLADAPVIAHGDRFTVGLIVRELVENAVLAVKGLPSPRVRVRAFRSGPNAMITIEDNGPGIARHLHRVVFEPFMTTHREDGAKGLGLAVCRERAAQTQGEIFVRSEPFRGAAFSLRLRAV